METDNTYPWSEEHDLSVTAYDVCGWWSEAELRIPTQSVPGNPGYVRDSSSLFACGPHFGSGVMTYLVAALDETGAVSDCLAFGHDPQGVVDGVYDVDFINAPSFDHTSCGVAPP
jgi:hypothetical protein